MTISSVQDTYSITFDSSTITIPPLTASDVITVTGSTASPSYYTIASGSTSTTYTTSGSMNGVSYEDIVIRFPEEWVNCFPEWDRIEKMCEEYPGLKIAFERFKTTYKLVKDDYDTPKDKRPKP